MRYRITTQKEKYSSEQDITILTSEREAIEKYRILSETNHFCLLEMGVRDVWERVNFRINDKNGNENIEAEVRYILQQEEDPK